MPTRPLAARTQPFQESVIREMTRLGEEAGAVNLSQGLPDFEPPALVLEAALQAIRTGQNQYTFPFGLPAFRRALAGKSASFNHIPADPETDITVTCGVSEAILCAFLALSDPGDEVILFEPWYENYVPDCQLAGLHPRFVSLHPPDYSFDLDELRRAFNAHTRLIVINTPHNPTGKVFSYSELTQIAELCRQYDVVAVTDEIYERIVYDGYKHVSIGSLPGMQDRCVTISGLGKTYAVTGWRVGWAIAAPHLTALIRKVHDYLTVCAPAPFQAAGIAALELPDDYYAEMQAAYASRRARLLAALDAAGFSYLLPQGAYYVMADFSRLAWQQSLYARSEWSPDRNFAEYLAREIGVAVVPGASFYTSGRGGETTVRFNFAKTDQTLQEAARRLARLNN